VEDRRRDEPKRFDLDSAALLCQQA
jgi:hypothetical protein